MITIRLHDSLPQEVLARLKTEATNDETARALAHKYLDQGRGRCLLRRPEAAEIVREALAYYDGNYYSLGDWVIMPNHVHFIYTKPQTPVGKICKSFKSYTGLMINRVIESSGPMWQRDYFDRYARDEEHFSTMGFYTLLNPVKAGLVADPFDWKYSSIHSYGPEFRDDLRRWYRQWRQRFWHSFL